MPQTGILILNKDLQYVSDFLDDSKVYPLLESFPAADAHRIKAMADAAFSGLKGQFLSKVDLLTGLERESNIEYAFSPYSSQKTEFCKIEYKYLNNSYIDSYEAKSNMLDSLLSNLPGMAVRFKNHIDWPTDFISEGVIELTGYTPEEFMSQSVLYGRITNPEDNLRVYKIIQEAISIKQKYTVDYRITAKNGEMKWVWEQGQGVFNPDGTLDAIECFITDITHYKNALIARKQSEQKYKSILRAIPDLVFIQSADGTYIDFYRQKNVDWVYLDPDNMMGKSMHELLPKELADKLQSIIDESIATGTPRKFEYSLPIKGKETYFEATSVAVNENMVLRLVRNITDIVMAEKAMKERNKELDAFVYKVSHDLKAPLKSVKGLVNLLKMYDSSENTRNMAGMIEESINKMDNFIQTSLSYTRSISVPVNPEQFDPESFINKCMEEIKHMPGADNVQLIVDVSADATAVQDIFRLGTIIKNLASNAVKYRNQTINNSYLRIEVSVDKDCMVWKISDNGIGVSEEAQPRLFEMFYRATTKGEGTGLGLHIVKLSVEKMGGTLDFSAVDGQGTAFVITLPNLI